ncbi:hypothetical protein A2U01_0062374, partial [Trifolium medium]|nr:hypothetical protein [Trifolium medium]
MPRAAKYEPRKKGQTNQWEMQKMMDRFGPNRVRYLPERVLRKFGYVQTIPRHPHAAANELTTVVQIDHQWLQHMD